MQGKYFYDFTRSFSDRIGETTSLIWASYGGVWKIREESIALSSLSSAPDWKKIEGHLFGGAPKSGGVDIKSLSTSPWQVLDTSFSSLILTQGAALYEDWSSALARHVVAPSKRIKAESFQFPSGHTNSNYHNWSILDAPGVITESIFQKTQFQPGLVARWATNIGNLDHLLRWFRFFKEMRNCIAHHGSQADAKVVSAHTAAIATQLKALGVSRDFLGPAPVLGAKLQIDPKDAVLLFSVISRIANAFDAKYCHTQAAEQHLYDRIAAKLLVMPIPKGRTLTERRRWYQNYLSKQIKVSPSSWPDMYDWLKAKAFL